MDIYSKARESAYLLDLGGESIKIYKKVDPRICKGRHAGLMVRARVHVVHTDGVGAQFGHANDISLALGIVHQGVVGGELIGDTWRGQPGVLVSRRSVRTFDVVLSSVLEEELGADSLNGWHGVHSGRL